MCEKSGWMKGLLWAEEYLISGIFFADDPEGKDSLKWELFYSGEFSPEYDGDFIKGAVDYLEYYESVLENISTQ